ncbi:MAG: hypothetical protein DSZ08_06640, partial [Sulfurovum sp.]
KFIYCVVYKNDKSYNYRIEKGVSRFGLNQYKESGLVDDIFTEDVGFFTKQFKKQFQKELTC